MASREELERKIEALESELWAIRVQLQPVAERLKQSRRTAQRGRSLVRIGTVFGALVVALGVSIVYASIPDPHGLIHGCYNRTNGSLRVVDPSSGNKGDSQCATTEASLTWSQKGPAGLTGATGKTGKVGMSWKGTWSSKARYAKSDAVFEPSDGSAWIARKANMGSKPGAGNANWSLLASRGAQGIQGTPGKAGLTWKGDWDPTKSYVKNDAVFDSSSGSSWIATAPNSGSEPSDSSPNWSLLAAQGGQGNPGKDAPARVTGYINPSHNPATIFISDSNCTASYSSPYWTISCPAGTFSGPAVPFVETFGGAEDLNEWGASGDGAFSMKVAPSSSTEIFWFSIDSLS